MLFKKSCNMLLAGAALYTCWVQIAIADSSTYKKEKKFCIFHQFLISSISIIYFLNFQFKKINKQKNSFQSSLIIVQILTFLNVLIFKNYCLNIVK